MDELDQIARGYGWTVKEWHRKVYSTIAGQYTKRHAALAMHGIFKNAEINTGSFCLEMYIEDEDVRERAKQYMPLVARALGWITLYDPPKVRDKDKPSTKKETPIEQKIREKAKSLRQHLYVEKVDKRTTPETRNRRSQQAKFYRKIKVMKQEEHV